MNEAPETADHASTSLLGDRTGLVVLSLMSVAFIAYQVVFIPRLGNNHFGDIEFSGWSGPMGSRLLSGERPYIDFILPIPPGSFAILAGLEAIVGAPRLMTELWLDAVLNLAMAWIAYFLVRPFTAGRVATTVAIGTLVTLGYLNKECAYDHTAQLSAWIAFLLGARALVATGPRRRRLFFWAGFSATFTVFFKQSTALGATLGWLACLGYLVLIEWRSDHRDRARALLTDVVTFLKGCFGGVWLTWGALVALGTTAAAFFQAAFLDASILKGGTDILAKNVFVYLFLYPAYPGSLFIIGCFVVAMFWLVKRRGQLGVGDEPGRSSPYTLLDRVLLPLLASAGFVAGALVLAFGPPGYPFDWLVHFDRLKAVPTFGLVLSGLFFIVHLVRTPEPPGDAEGRLDPVRTGHVLNGLWLASLACTILHNTSAPEFRPFYDNNPIIPLSLFALFVAIDRLGSRLLHATVLILIVVSLGGNRFYRAMIATIDAPDGAHWAGMKLSPRGKVMSDVADRVREVTEPDDEVLVLPEDVNLVAQIGRPRPKLRGAIVFVDQYAPRLADDDIARLEAHPPKVIVIHPRDPRKWQRFFRIWSGHSGAEQVMQHVLRYMLPARYDLDRRYPTNFLWKAASLDIYVRRDGERLEAVDEATAAPEDQDPEQDP